MKKFFNEFKTFISRGKVVDLAVGVIIGSAFTAIVTALSNWILKPIINYLLALTLGANSLTEVYTFLKWVPSDIDPATADLTKSIYIDWGAFINAIINFLLIAIVLFLIVKIINKIQSGYDMIKDNFTTLTKQDKKELKKLGIKLIDVEAVNKYLANKRELAKKAEEEAKAKEPAKPTVEELLTDIKSILEQSTNKTVKEDK